MGLPEVSSPPTPYPKEIQVKLYQSFIFSIPILFSIILFLLFYLFYLKRRASNVSSPSPTLPSISNQSTQFVNQVLDLKGDLKEKLTIITFNENLRAKDSQCCVCLGEFEMEEELQQIPSCKHVFHIECINHWLQANLTCPLCRSSLLPTRKPSNPGSPLRFNLLWQTNLNSNNYPQLVSATEQQGGVTSSSQPSLSSEEAPSRRNEESSGGQIGSQEFISPPIDDRMVAGSNANSVVIEIQMRSA